MDPLFSELPCSHSHPDLLSLKPEHLLFTSPEAPGPVLGWDGGGQLLAVGLTLFYANLQTFFKFSARSYCSYKCSFSPVPDHAIEIYIYLYFLTLIPKAL